MNIKTIAAIIVVIICFSISALFVHVMELGNIDWQVKRFYSALLGVILGCAASGFIILLYRIEDNHNDE